MTKIAPRDAGSEKPWPRAASTIGLMSRADSFNAIPHLGIGVSVIPSRARSRRRIVAAASVPTGGRGGVRRLSTLPGTSLRTSRIRWAGPSPSSSPTSTVQRRLHRAGSPSSRRSDRRAALRSVRRTGTCTPTQRCCQTRIHSTRCPEDNQRPPCTSAGRRLRRPRRGPRRSTRRLARRSGRRLARRRSSRRWRARRRRSRRHPRRSRHPGRPWRRSSRRPSEPRRRRWSRGALANRVRSRSPPRPARPRARESPASLAPSAQGAQSPPRHTSGAQHCALLVHRPHAPLTHA